MDAASDPRTGFPRRSKVSSAGPHGGSGTSSSMALCARFTTTSPATAPKPTVPRPEVNAFCDTSTS
eukprot:8680042-Pyramimonas_sp.AAC.1